MYLKKVKRGLSILIAFSMLACCGWESCGQLTLGMSAYAEEETADTTDVSEETPSEAVEISTLEQLIAFRDSVNEGNNYEGQTVILMNDIDMSDVYNEETGESWTPIGADENRFNGTFDGNGYKINNIYLYSDYDSVALFGSIAENGVVKNLGISSGVITGNACFAGIAVTNYGTIEKCYNECDIEVTDIIDITGRISGIACTNHGTITECYNTGRISNQFSISDIGGIAAVNEGTISKCYNSGYTGGLISNVGGIAGQNDGLIEDCYNNGNLFSQRADKSNDKPCTGGITGSNNSGQVLRCYHAGALIYDPDGNYEEPLGDDYLGAVIGRNNGGTFEDCYYLEGSKGTARGGVENSDPEGVKSVSEADLASEETFENWDFENVWTMSADSNTPVLRAFNDEEIDPTEPTEATEETEETTSAAIEKTELDISMFKAIEEQYYTGEAVTPKIALNASYEGDLPAQSDYTVQYHNNTEAAEADGTTGPYAEITASEDGNFTGSVILTFNIINIPEPVKAISLGNKSWTALSSEISFESYKSDLEFSVSYEDEYMGTTAKIEYCIVETPMTEDELAAYNSWVEYNDNRKPVIRGNRNQVIYAKFTDNNGKVSYINSDGIFVDSIAPVVSNVKIEDNKLAFNVDDEGSTYYYVILDKINAFITAEDIISMAEKPSSSDGSVASGTKSVAASDVTDGTVTVNLPNLEDGKDYFAYVVARDTVVDISGEETGVAHNTSEIADNVKVTKISNLDELKAFRESVNAESNSNDYKNQIVELAANIDINNEQWTAIGNSSSPFNGVFRGNGFIISNINVNGEHCQGLFGYVGSEGVIMDLGIQSGSVKGQNTVGSIAGQNFGTVMNCYSAADVEGLSSVGGIVGQNSAGGKVENCYSIGTVTSSTDATGGIAGSNLGTVNNCYYLTGGAAGGIGGSDKAGSAEGKTADEFKSGEITWLLQGNQADLIWGQGIGTNDFPTLTSNEQSKVVEVKFYINKTNGSKEYINSGGKVTLPDAATTNTNYEFVKWSNSNEIGGQEVTKDTPITEDVTLYAIYKENFTIAADSKRVINAIYGTAFRQRLNEYITYSGNLTPKSTVAGNFTYEIASEVENFNGTIDGDTLTIIDTPVDEYTVKIRATEKPSIKEINGLGYTEYGNGTATFDVSVKVTQGTMNITKPSAKRLTYTGEPQELINAAGKIPDGATVQYKLGINGEYKNEIPTAVDAGSYTVYYKVDGGKNYNDIAETSLPVTISKARPVVVNPTAKTGLEYTGEELELINAGTTTGGVLQYALDSNAEADYSTDIPKSATAGPHTVYYRVKGDDNYLDVAQKSVRVTIAKAKPEVVAPTIKEDLVYDGEEHELVNPGTTTGGEIRYSVDKGVTYTTNIPVGTNAGTYEFQWRVIGGDNYSDTAAVKMSVTIEKADYEFTAPIVNELEYTGFEQQLVSDGICNDATIEYSTDGEEYTTDIPTAIYAGTYTVYYRVVGDDNHNNIGPVELEAIIEKGTPEIEVPEAKELIYNGTAQELVTPGSVGIQYSLEEEGEYSEDIPTAINAGTYTVYYKMAGDENTKDIGPIAIEVTIEKATPVVTVHEPTKKLVYNGSEQNLILATVNVGDILYSMEEDSEYTSDIPTAVNAGTYTVYYKVEGSENYKEIEPTAVEVTIEKATPTVVVKPAELIYNGSEQELISEAHTDMGEIQYGFDGDDSYSTEIPTGVNAGTYNIFYLIEGNENYNSVEAKAIEVTIAKADIEVTAPEAKKLVYSGIEQELITEGSSNVGEMLYSLEEDGEYTADIPTAVNAGTYNVYYKVEADENYNAVETAFVEVIIGKATPNIISVPKAYTLVYNGEEQELISEGSSDVGEMQYSLGIDGEFSPEIPTAVNAGTYMVYYKVEADENYIVLTPLSAIEVTIDKAIPEIIEPTAKELIYNGSEQELINAGSVDAGEMLYSLSKNGKYSAEIPTAVKAGTYTVYYQTETDNNYETLSGTVSVTISEAITTAATTSDTTTTTTVTTISTVSDTTSITNDTGTSSTVSTSDIVTTSSLTSVSTSDTVTSSSVSTSDTVTSSSVSTSDTVTSSSTSLSTTNTITSPTSTSESTDATSTTEVTTSTEPQVTRYVLAGDANDDGVVNIRDAAYIARALANSQLGIVLPSYADYNRDGKANIRDAAAIARDLANGKMKWIKIFIVIRN